MATGADQKILKNKRAFQTVFTQFKGLMDKIDQNATI